jgi:hypothetical protein
LKKLNRKKGVFSMIKKYRKISLIVACVAIIAIFSMVQPARAAVSSFLSIFRVENVDSINISINDINKITRNLEKDNPKFQLDKFGKISSKGGKKNNIETSKLVKEKNLKIIPQSSGYIIDSHSELITNFEMTFKLNIKNVNKFMKSYNLKSQFPQSVDGKEIKLIVPEQIITTYIKDNVKYSVRQFKKPSIFAQSKSDIDKIRKALLELPFIPKNIANQLKSIKDWDSTLYIPTLGMKETKKTINGKETIIFTNSNKNEKQLTVHNSAVWIENEYIYNVWGNGSSEQFIDILKLLR